MSTSDDAADFLREYERRTNAHGIEALCELIADDATYWFTDGSHRGVDAIAAAISETFRTIPDEIYRISDVEWVHVAEDAATVRYRFDWAGTIDGRPASGSGRGTNVMTRVHGRWLMQHEHLSS
ncbi:nuclear transport factor 2 family protein [Microbacterium sp. SORGH_AS_0888]|uniref:YybH family protein n=1 Tax=Microbacterium sp. SORGH_AS_0888 TaxID=3041791 RepID=UPI0027D7F889|nr:nuclear transport factor 2 family protein [Microbacterium sp. SORGH_AS_0888]